MCTVQWKKLLNKISQNCCSSYMKSQMDILANINVRIVVSFTTEVHGRMTLFWRQAALSFGCVSDPFGRGHRPRDSPLNRVSLHVCSPKSMELLRFYDCLTLTFNAQALTLSDASRWVQGHRRSLCRHCWGSGKKTPGGSVWLAVWAVLFASAE